MDTDDSDRNLYDSDDDSNDSSQDEICYIKDHKIVNNSMKLYVTWVKGGREWSDLEHVRKYFPNLVKQYMETKISNTMERVLKRNQILRKLIIAKSIHLQL